MQADLSVAIEQLCSDDILESRGARRRLLAVFSPDAIAAAVNASESETFALAASASADDRDDVRCFLLDALLAAAHTPNVADALARPPWWPLLSTLLEDASSNVGGKAAAVMAAVCRHAARLPSDLFGASGASVDSLLRVTDAVGADARAIAALSQTALPAVMDKHAATLLSGDVLLLSNVLLAAATIARGAGAAAMPHTVRILTAVSVEADGLLLPFALRALAAAWEGHASNIAALSEAAAAVLSLDPSGDLIGPWCAAVGALGTTAPGAAVVRQVAGESLALRFERTLRHGQPAAKGWVVRALIDFTAPIGEGSGDAWALLAPVLGPDSFARVVWPLRTAQDAALRRDVWGFAAAVLGAASGPHPPQCFLDAVAANVAPSVNAEVSATPPPVESLHFRRDMACDLLRLRPLLDGIGADWSLLKDIAS